MKRIVFPASANGVWEPTYIIRNVGAITTTVFVDFYLDTGEHVETRTYELGSMKGVTLGKRDVPVSELDAPYGRHFVIIKCDDSVCAAGYFQNSIMRNQVVLAQEVLPLVDSFIPDVVEPEPTVPDISYVDNSNPHRIAVWQDSGIWRYCGRHDCRRLKAGLMYAVQRAFAEFVAFQDADYTGNRRIIIGDCCTAFEYQTCEGHQGRHLRGKEMDLNYLTTGPDHYTQYRPVSDHATNIWFSKSGGILNGLFDARANGMLWYEIGVKLPKARAVVDNKIHEAVLAAFEDVDSVREWIAKKVTADSSDKFRHDTHVHFDLGEVPA